MLTYTLRRGRKHIHLDSPEDGAVCFYDHTQGSIREPDLTVLRHHAEAGLKAGCSLYYIIEGPGGTPIEIITLRPQTKVEMLLHIQAL